jgi:hypothetical protein
MFLKGRFARCLLTLGVTDDAAGCTRDEREQREREQHVQRGRARQP